MAKITKGQMRTLVGKNPKLKLNLKEIFGSNFEGKADLRAAIGQALIDKIQERTESGIGLNGRNFRGYSKSYKKSLDFKAAGKSSKVNLRLTGDMLELMDITDETPNMLTLGWGDSKEAAKAHGHITGSARGPGVRRDFFGLRSSDISEIRAQFADELDSMKKTSGKKDGKS